MNREIPLQIEGITENIYAGFWSRLWSLLLDLIFTLPFAFLILYVNGLGKSVFFYTLIPSLVFGFWYNIYLPKKYGGTPGKLVAGIKIIRLDGESIGWKEAFLRHSVLLGLTILNGVMMSVSLLEADEVTFISLGWMEQSKYLISLSPLFFKLYSIVSNCWVYSEFVVMFTNKRKRAIHDFIAETVIVKSKYIDDIEMTMNKNSQDLSRDDDSQTNYGDLPTANS